jgi:transcriptional regulator with XRE-family HTH domain
MDKQMATQRKEIPYAIDVMVGRLIRSRRQQLSMSQTDLAKALGLTFQQIKKYEKGTSRVSCSRLSEISEVLDSPITFFFSEVCTPAITAPEHLERVDLKESFRLIDAFSKIEKAKRKNVLALVESMVPVKRADV